MAGIGVKETKLILSRTAGTITILIITMAPVISVARVVHQLAAAQYDSAAAEGAYGFFWRYWIGGNFSSIWQ